MMFDTVTLDMDFENYNDENIFYNPLNTFFLICSFIEVPCYIFRSPFNIREIL